MGSEIQRKKTYKCYTKGPWEMQTSCSFRRIGAGADGNVLYATTQRSDGHPDLVWPNGGFEGPDAQLMLDAPLLYEENVQLEAQVRTLEAEKVWLREFFAEYWGNACPDCGPDDYEWMIQEAIGHAKTVATQAKQISELQAQNTQLAERLRRMAGPVTGAEKERFSFSVKMLGALWAEVDALLASRAQSEGK